jgi:hypothetical protein
MTDMNTAGAASMTHEIERVDGSSAFIVTDGHSVLDTPEDLFTKIDLIVHGQARYDLERGEIEYTDLDENGEMTASSINSQNPVYYKQVSWISRIEPDGTYAALDPKKGRGTEPNALSAPPMPTPNTPPPPTPATKPAEGPPPPPTVPGGTKTP